MFSHSLDNCAHKSQSDSSDVASYCMKKNSMSISHDDWQGEGVVCSHFKSYVGSRANTIRITPPCLLHAGSALSRLSVKRKVDTKRSSTFQGKCFSVVNIVVVQEQYNTSCTALPFDRGKHSEGALYVLSLRCQCPQSPLDRHRGSEPETIALAAPVPISWTVPSTSPYS